MVNKFEKNGYEEEGWSECGMWKTGSTEQKKMELHVPAYERPCGLVRTGRALFHPLFWGYE